MLIISAQDRGCLALYAFAKEAKGETEWGRNIKIFDTLQQFFFFLLISVHNLYVSVPRFGEAGGDVELTIPALLRATPKLIRQLLLLQNIYKYIPKFGL